MALSIVREGGAVQMADVLVFNTRRTPPGERVVSNTLTYSRDQYLEGLPERMERIRRLARAALEREQREGKAGGGGAE